MWTGGTARRERSLLGPGRDNALRCWRSLRRGRGGFGRPRRCRTMRPNEAGACPPAPTSGKAASEERGRKGGEVAGFEMREHKRNHDYPRDALPQNGVHGGGGVGILSRHNEHLVDGILVSSHFQEEVGALRVALDCGQVQRRAATLRAGGRPRQAGEGPRESASRSENLRLCDCESHITRMHSICSGGSREQLPRQRTQAGPCRPFLNQPGREGRGEMRCRRRGRR